VKALRILNLEDNPQDTELLHATLTRGGVACEILRVQTRTDFVAALESGKVDLVLADYSLPSFDGISALKVAQEIHPEVPFVLVSGTIEEERAIKALKSGAMDYVLKERLEKLVPVVRRAVSEAEERTERKRAEEALQYQLGLTRTITNNAADSLFLWDAEGRVTFMNPAAEQTFGWRQEELLGEVLHDKMHHHRPDGQPYPISECPLLRIFESGQTLRDHEDLFFRKDGSPVDVGCSHAPIIVDGKITGAVLVVRDITERKRAEEALRESEERFRLTFELAGVGMAHVGLDGRWLRINDKLLEIVGYSREELLDLTFQEITHPEDLDADLRHIRRLLSGQIQTYSTEKRYIKKDRSRVWIELTVSLVGGSSGEPEYFISIIEDITERKLKELLPDPLTSRELEALRLIARGGTNRQVAQGLKHSVATAKLEVRRVIAKLGASNRHEAVTRAVEIGLIPPR
jgi:PAS domain S-box-containing protein